MKNTRRHGFTVVELAVVIFVLAILVAITATGYRVVQNRAHGANVVTALRSVESAFQTFSSNMNRESWIDATQFQGTAGANMSAFLAPSYVPSSGQDAVVELRRQLPKGVPEVNGAEGLAWEYRNNGTTRTTSACNDVRDGALIVLRGVPEAVFTQLDKEFDDAKKQCGKIRYTASGELLYQLGFVQKISN